MKLKITYKPTFLILILFTFVSYGQEITLIDFGLTGQQTTSGNWNNITDSNTLNNITSLIDDSGVSTGETIKLTDPFDIQINGWGTTSPDPVLPFPSSASRDNFFGENVTFFGSNEPTGGFTLSGLEIGKYYSFTIFASRMGVSDNREALYTITGNAGPQTATLNAANNTSNVATILYVQPNSSSEITIQAETGPLNTNGYGWYYLGAIEMIKTTCISTVTWNGVWNGTPDLSTEVIIDANCNTSASIGSFSACSLTVNTGATLTVDDNTFVEVKNDVVVNGSLIVETQGNFVQRDNAGTFKVNAGGLARVNKTTASKGDWFYYTYWSSPVSGQTVGNAFPNTDGDRRFWFNAPNYLDINGDDVDDNGDDWQNALGGDIMIPGVGYAATSGRFGLYPGTDNAAFDGLFNTGDITTNISYNLANLFESWNFIGNPYPCAIDFEAFQLANSSVVGGVAYFWSQASLPDSSNPGNEQLNFNQNDYAMYSIGLGAGTAGGGPDIPTKYVPSGQGFFIEGLDNNPATFTNVIRMADATSNNLFFKNSSSKKKNSNTLDNKLWINLTSDNGVFNQILVGYVNGATNNDDGSFYDARKIVASNTYASLYSSIDNSNKRCAIQGKAINNLNEDEIIKLGLYTTIDVPTLYALSIAQLEGDFLTSNTIYLKDNLLNKLHDLSASDYTFTSEVGEFNDRFEIVFNSAALSTADIDANSNTLKIVELGDDAVQFTASKAIKTIRVFDLLGRQLYQFEGNKTSETYTLSNLNNTIYIAKVTLLNGATITKKAFKK